MFLFTDRFYLYTLVPVKSFKETDLSYGNKAVFRECILAIFCAIFMYEYTKTLI